MGGKTLWQKSTKHYLEIKIKNIKNIEEKKSYNKSIPRILDNKNDRNKKIQEQNSKKQNPNKEKVCYDKFSTRVMKSF